MFERRKNWLISILNIREVNHQMKRKSITVDGNNQITANDAREIQNFSVGLISKFTADEL